MFNYLDRALVCPLALSHPSLARLNRIGTTKYAGTDNLIHLAAVLTP
jgi:hypothetical protein